MRPALRYGYHRIRNDSSTVLRRNAHNERGCVQTIRRDRVLRAETCSAVRRASHVNLLTAVILPGGVDRSIRCGCNVYTDRWTGVRNRRAALPACFAVSREKHVRSVAGAVVVVADIYAAEERARNGIVDGDQGAIRVADSIGQLCCSTSGS